jgi:hypothetical protein
MKLLNKDYLFLSIAALELSLVPILLAFGARALVCKLALGMTHPCRFETYDGFETLEAFSDV